jgi:hypothetical protein
VPDIVPRRRILLASATTLPLLLATAGCRSSSLFAGPDPLAGRPPLGHDVLTLQAVIASEENMINLYRAAINGDPGTAAPSRTLGPLLAQHEQHLAQLRARLIEPAGTPATPSQASRPAASAGGGSPSTGPARVTTAQLRAAERASAAGLVQRLATVEPALAQLFASIAASDATHVTVLADNGLAG